MLTVSLTFTSIPAAACLWLVGEALTVPIRHMKPTQRFSAFHLTQITNKFHEFSVVSSEAILSFFFLLLCSCSSYYLFWIVKYLHELLYNFIFLFPTSQSYCIHRDILKVHIWTLYSYWINNSQSLINIMVSSIQPWKNEIFNF